MTTQDMTPEAILATLRQRVAEEGVTLCGPEKLTKDLRAKITDAANATAREFNNAGYQNALGTAVKRLAELARRTPDFDIPETAWPAITTVVLIELQQNATTTQGRPKPPHTVVSQTVYRGASAAAEQRGATTPTAAPQLRAQP